MSVLKLRLGQISLSNRTSKSSRQSLVMFVLSICLARREALLSKATTGRLELRVLSLSAVLDTSEKDAKVGSSSIIFFVMMSWSVLICSITEDIADSLVLYYYLSEL